MCCMVGGTFSFVRQQLFFGRSFDNDVRNHINKKNILYIMIPLLPSNGVVCGGCRGRVGDNQSSREYIYVHGGSTLTTLSGVDNLEPKILAAILKWFCPSFGRFWSDCRSFTKGENRRNTTFCRVFYPLRKILCSIIVILRIFWIRINISYCVVILIYVSDGLCSFMPVIPSVFLAEVKLSMKTARSSFTRGWGSFFGVMGISEGIPFFLYFLGI